MNGGWITLTDKDKEIVSITVVKSPGYSLPEVKNEKERQRNLAEANEDGAKMMFWVSRKWNEIWEVHPNYAAGHQRGWADGMCHRPAEITVSDGTQEAQGYVDGYNEGVQED